MHAVDPREILRLGLRQDFPAFIHRTFQTVNPGARYRANWHIDAMAYYLERCYKREITRLIITLPPRNLKSITASVAFPAWVLGKDPSANLVCISYSADLSAKHARDCRRVIQSPWYRQAFPGTVPDKSKNSAEEFTTTRGGHRLSTSVGGVLTGRGGDYLIIDDPLKPQDAYSDTLRNGVNEWYDSTLYSRLNDKKRGVIVLVMQRLHQDDLVSHILEKEDWHHLNLPAIAPVAQRVPIGRDRWYEREPGEVLHREKEPEETLKALKNTLGTAAFSAQYLQEPVPPEGALIKWNWFGFYKELPHNHDAWVVQSWDTASKSGELNDYSVCTTWSIVDNQFYLLDVYRAKLDFPDLRAAAIELAQKHGPRTILVEDTNSGTALIQELRGNRYANVPTPRPIKPQGDKATRVYGQSATIEQGRVFLPKEAKWLEAFREEINAFPYGRHDDQVDSLSQFLSWFNNRQGFSQGESVGLY